MKIELVTAEAVERERERERERESYTLINKKTIKKHIIKDGSIMSVIHTV